MRALIADDSSLMINRIMEALSDYKDLEIIGMVNNGITALEKALLLKPDLTILDLKMPGLNGINVLKEIRKVNPDMTIIILTYYLSDYYKIKAFELGADYVYSKVDDFDKVPLTIGKLILKNNSRERALS